MHTVERTLHRDMDVFLVNLAIRASVLGIAHTGSVVAPAGISTVIRAGLQTAINPTKPRFAPARAIHAQSVVRAVVHTDRDLAIRPRPLRTAHAAAIVTLSVGQSTSISAQLHRAVKIGPWISAFASPVRADTVSSALVGARRHRAIHAGESAAAETSAVAAIAVAGAVVLAPERRAIR